MLDPADAVSSVSPTSPLVGALVGGLGALVAVCVHWRLRSRGPITLTEVGWSTVAFVLGSAAGAVVLLTGGTAIHAMVAGFVVSMMILDAEYARSLLGALANLKSAPKVGGGNGD